MSARFAGPKAKNYKFMNPDGTVDRHVIALFMGNKKIGFMEYDTARRFVDKIHDLCDDHDREQRTKTLETQ